jgi:hypothetical protein
MSSPMLLTYHSKCDRILGDLTFQRKLRNLDKKRTPTYLWGRYLSLRQRFQMAAFLASSQLCPMSDPAMSMGGVLLMAEKSVGSRPPSSVAQIRSYICTHLGSLHSWHPGDLFLIHGGPSRNLRDEWTSRHPSLWENWWMDGL